MLDPTQRLARIAGAGEIIAVLGAVAIGLYAAGRWLDQRQLAQTLVRELSNVPAPEGGTLVAAYLVTLMPAIIFAIAMLEARGLFALLRRGELFSPAIPRRLVRLGAWAGASALAGFALRTILVLVLTAGAAPGQRQLLIGISSSEIAALVVALLLFAFALVMQEAIRIDEDRQGIV